MTQKITSVNIESATLSSFTGPTISSISIANSSYTILDDTAVSNAGGFAVITGSNFQSGAQVLFGSISATSVTFVDSSTLRVQVPALTAGSYVTYVQNGDGSTAIRLNGITSSPIPVWSTGSTLTQQDTGTPFSISLSATSDSSVIYSVANGSSLPSGTTLAANGLFSGTINAVDETTYNFTVNAIDAENQDTSRSFSVNVSVGDIYYNLTTLHLNANPSSNSWINDASTNSFNLTVAGDARPVGFSPYETVWSNFFDGTGDFLSLANNAALNPGTQDFLMEAWVYITGTTGNNQGFNGKGTAGTDGYSFFITNGLVLSFIWNGTGGTTITAGTLTLNTWNHVAVVRNSNVIRLYLNGVGAVSSTACTTDITSTATKFIGQARGANPILGYMSNYRMIKGALPSGYDATSSTITVPSLPLTAVTNTSVLTCQSNRLIDNSTNNFTLTKNGDVTVTNFGPSVETDITTGSGYFDGTNDYLTIPNDINLQLGSDNFTVEGWFNSLPTKTGSVVGFYTKGVNTTGGIIFGVSSDFILCRHSGTTDLSFNSGTGTNSSQWVHVAWVRNGSQLTIFRNGINVASASVSFNQNDTSAVQIGSPASIASATNRFGGYVSNFRIIKGTAVYTGNFIPPINTLVLTGSSPYSNTANVNTTFSSANTSLLSFQNRMGDNTNRFIDTSGINSIIVRSGNPVQLTNSPFSASNWSNYFDGTGDYITVADNDALDGFADFTVEGWIYMANTSAGVQSVITKGASGVFQPYYFYITSSRVLTFSSSSAGASHDISNATTLGTLALNTWYHIAASRSGSSLRLFLNGSLITTITNSSTLVNNTRTVGIGGRGDASELFNGYISNVRLVKGTAVYTAAFTPPTTPLTAIANTVLLTCQSNRFRDNSSNNFTISTFGDTSVQPFSPFNPNVAWSETSTGGSIYFDGTGDFLTIASSNTIALSTGDFTWESWIYLDITTIPTFTDIYDQRNGTNGASVIQPVIELTSTNGYAWYVAAANRITSGAAAVRPRSWQHLAISRSSGTTRMFLDGVQVGAPYTDTNNYPAGSLTIGRANDGVNTRNFTGYLSGLRVTKGQALYTANTSPPTLPPTNTPNTVLLLTGTNAGITDATGRSIIETFADSKISTKITKFGNNSIYFDGAGDYINVLGSNNFEFGASDFTLEFWMYQLSSTGTQCILDAWNNSPTRFLVRTNGTSLQFFASPSNTSYTLPAINTWYHVAAVRNGSTFTLYVDGTSRGTFTSSASLTGSVPPAVWTISRGSEPFNGYLKDIRITKGFARYTANFTAPLNTFKVR